MDVLIAVFVFDGAPCYRHSKLTQARAPENSVKQ